MTTVLLATTAATLTLEPPVVPESILAYCKNITDGGCHSHIPLPVPLYGPTKRQLLVVGDSVSMGWTPLLSNLLTHTTTAASNSFRSNNNSVNPLLTPAPEFEVHHVGQENATLQNCSGTSSGSACNMANAGDSCRGFVCVTQHDPHCDDDSCWIRPTGQEETWDMILFNFGLHDIEKDRSNPNSTYEIPIDDYRVLLANITATLQKRTKELMWVTTTPLPANGTSDRTNEDVIKYNKVAAAVMSEASASGTGTAEVVHTCDLYGFVEQHCGVGYTTCDWQPSPPHFPGYYIHLAEFIQDCVLHKNSTKPL